MRLIVHTGYVHGRLLALRFAWHVSPLTTTHYTHPSAEEMDQQVRTLSC